MQNAVATATFADSYAGKVAAFLVPQKTSRNGARITVYRWMNERGYNVDGLRTGFSIERMIAHAKSHALFGEVAQKA